MPQVLSRHLATFTEWIMFLLKSIEPKEAGDSPKTQFAVAALQLLVATPLGRAICLASDGLPVLYSLISAAGTSASVQLLYQTIFSLWSLSYSPEAAMAMVSSKVGIIPKLVETLKTVQKEKVIRVTLATLRNLLGTGSASADMVAAGVMPVLHGLQPRKWADEDILEDVDLLISALQVNLQTLTSWDVYKKEVSTGKLEWSPSHKSANFWKDNHKAFEAGAFETVKQLVALLKSEDPQVGQKPGGLRRAVLGGASVAARGARAAQQEASAVGGCSSLLDGAPSSPPALSTCTLPAPPQVLAIACNDIAEFVGAHPDGRRLMIQHGAKAEAMQVLKHPDPQVQKYALLCVQRLMVINWEYLSKA